MCQAVYIVSKILHTHTHPVPCCSLHDLCMTSAVVYGIERQQVICSRILYTHTTLPVPLFVSLSCSLQYGITDLSGKLHLWQGIHTSSKTPFQVCMQLLVTMFTIQYCLLYMNMYLKTKFQHQVYLYSYLILSLYYLIPPSFSSSTLPPSLPPFLYRTDIDVWDALLSRLSFPRLFQLCSSMWRQQ